MRKITEDIDLIQEVRNLKKIDLDVKEKQNLDWGMKLLDAALSRQKYKKLNVHVIGNMKSGKSTFVNAMLGRDLLPNESAACTLVPVEICTEISSEEILKVLRDGSVQKIAGEKLEHLFLEDIRYYRRKLENGHAIDVERYIINHPLSIKKRSSKNVSLRIIDTPGPNEMKQFAEYLDLQNVISECLKESSQILFVLDIQYYKDEENQKLLNWIMELRPDLIDKIVFILNKTDRLMLHKEVTLENVITDVRSMLTDWGFEKNTLIPVSSKRAMLSRIVASSSNLQHFEEQYKQDFNELLPLIEKEIDGELLTLKPNVKLYQNQLFEESNFQRIDDCLRNYIVEYEDDFERSNAEALCKHVKNQIINVVVKKSNDLDFESLKEPIATIKEQERHLEEACKSMRLLIQEELRQTLLSGIDFEKIERELNAFNSFTRRFSSGSLPSYSTEWDQYRNDDGNYIDSDSTRPGREKQRLEDYYEDVMDDAYREVSYKVSELLSQSLVTLKANVDNHAQRVKESLEVIYKKSNLIMKLPFNKYSSTLIKENFSPYRLSVSQPWVEQKVVYEERKIFKGMQEKRYDKFRLTNVSSFRESARGNVSFLFESANNFIAAQLRKMIEEQIETFYRQQFRQGLSLLEEREKELKVDSKKLEEQWNKLLTRKKELSSITQTLEAINVQQRNESEGQENLLVLLFEMLSAVTGQNRGTNFTYI